MRSGNYGNVYETYGRWDLAHKVRRALVEGLANKENEKEKARYIRLVKHFSVLDKQERVNILANFLENPKSRQENLEFFNGLLNQFHPKHGLWLPFEKKGYEKLREEGVIFVADYNDLSDLVTGLVQLPPYKVLYTNTDIVSEGVDYSKKIKSSRKLMLNGKHMIEAFAEGRFELPESFKEYGRMTTEVYNLLIKHGFSFPESLKAASKFLRTKGQNLDLAVLSIRRPDGNETYFFPKDIIERTELYYEIRRHRSGRLSMEHGSLKEGEFKYHGENMFYIPRRAPTSKKPMDKVQVKYFPDLERLSDDMFLGWFKTEMNCDCDYSLDFRNKEERTGEMMVRYTKVMDIHSGVCLLWVHDKIGEGSQQIVYPTAFGVSIVDRIRYLLHNRQGNGEREINRLFNEALKIYGFDDLFQLEPTKESAVLKPLYTSLQR